MHTSPEIENTLANHGEQNLRWYFKDGTIKHPTIRAPQQLVELELRVQMVAKKCIF